MAVEVKLSSLGVSITEGTIVRWLRREGDRVEKGEVLAEVETEKVNFEIVSPETGVLLKVFYGEKTVAPVDSTVALVGSSGEDTSSYFRKEIKERSSAEPESPGLPKKTKEAPERFMAYPGAKMLAREHGLDLSEVVGTGPSGQITREDVQKHLKQKQSLPQEGRIPELEEIIPMVGMRKSIAEAMSLSVRTAAHVTTVAEVDMTEMVKLRGELSPDWKREGINLTYVPFVLRAAIQGIERFPAVNSQIIQDKLVIKKYVHCGVVVAVPEGLITPVLRRVETKGVKQIAMELEEMTRRARERKLALEDLRGGTITLSNPGVFGAVLATPIIYPPQSALLWMGRIAKTPVVRDEAIVIRSMMYLCLSYDHRALDGSMAAQFLQQVRKSLEEPQKLLIV